MMPAASASFNGAIFALTLALFSCSSKQNIYKSECDIAVKYKTIGFTQLLDSLKFYDKKYVEVTGKYLQGKEESILVNDSLFNDHSSNNSLWISFSQDCPLYLKGTHTGLFEFQDGEYVQLNKRVITMRGRIDIHNKGYQKKYKGAIDRVSFIKM